jgi:uncharacterized iron-regulated membrane protein
MKPAFWSRRLHKWLGLFVGLQALLWMASGLYMTAISIDVIHGDHLAHRDQTPLSEAVAGAQLKLDARFDGITGIKLKRMLGRDIVEVRHAGGVGLLDAATGVRRDPLDKATMQQLAESMYQGRGRVTRLELLATLPGEVATRKAPLWRADFDDGSATSLYFDPQTGDLVAKRHDLWRVFDFLWMLHIMDYDTRDDVNNTLLRIASVFGVLFGLSGLWLLWFSLRRRTSR